VHDGSTVSTYDRLQIRDTIDSYDLLLDLWPLRRRRCWRTWPMVLIHLHCDLFAVHFVLSVIVVLMLAQSSRILSRILFSYCFHVSACKHVRLTCAQ